MGVEVLDLEEVVLAVLVVAASVVVAQEVAGNSRLPVFKTN